MPTLCSRQTFWSDQTIAERLSDECIRFAFIQAMWWCKNGLHLLRKISEDEYPLQEPCAYRGCAIAQVSIDDINEFWKWNNARVFVRDVHPATYCSDSRTSTLFQKTAVPTRWSLWSWTEIICVDTKSTKLCTNWSAKLRWSWCRCVRNKIKTIFECAFDSVFRSIDHSICELMNNALLRSFGDHFICFADNPIRIDVELLNFRIIAIVYAKTH